ncbi:MAG: hypothetical protein GC168_08225 [Candidatus Hydrogenedens sp.]|nr:hypothetical protein [Candidatus Hydrogenedens sp.]
MFQRAQRLPFHAALLVVGVLALAGCSTQENVLLTWRGDTSTTMAVDFQSRVDAPGFVRYDIVSHDGEPGGYAHTAEAAARQIPGLDDRWFYTAELEGLEPGGTYYFVAGTEEGGYSREHKFHTVPAEGPVRFIEGGDQAFTPGSRRLLTQAASHEPDFAVIGGDIAYANGDTRNLWQWDLYLFNYRNRFVTPKGYLVPIMYAIGNHEVNDKEGPAPVTAPFFMGMINQADTTNFVRTAGEDTVFYFLDSSHTQTHESQVAWLDEQMAAHQDVPNQFAVYHVPLYPSHRDYDDPRSEAGREHWGPLFDKHHLDIGFEHHDHSFKRTKRITGGEVDPEGVLYLGDGSMGVPVRSSDNADAWYIEKASGTSHFWLVEVNAGKVHAQAIERSGEVFDEVTLGAAE